MPSPPAALLSLQQPVPAALPLPPPANRVRTKEETDAAHDLLELSRSLPPLQGPTSLHPAHPPTPPTPEVCRESRDSRERRAERTKIGAASLHKFCSKEAPIWSQW